MKYFNIKYKFLSICAVVVALTLAGCSRDVEELEPADYPTDGEVFIDGFSGGLNYAAFGGSVPTAFDTDTETKYKGTTSMVFRVPDVGDPAGSYAGGTYYLESGRDLSGYNVLSFWAKSSKAASIDIIGIGNDLGENTYIASISDVKVNSNWKQFFIPIPDPSKLTREKGMFFYSEGPEDGRGYTFWIDEVKFEKMGTLGPVTGAIQNGEDAEVTSEAGAVIEVAGSASADLGNGSTQTVNAAPAYFTFSSSDENVAIVNDKGQVMVKAEGSSLITAKLGTREAAGSLTVNSTGAPVLPATGAPAPMQEEANVISLYSDAYTDVAVDTWNTRWQFSTAEDEEVQVAGDMMRRYRMLNFVGIEFVTQRIDATSMTHFHMDLWTPEPTDGAQEFKILLVDFGPDGAFDGGDDTRHELTFTAPTLATESWVSLDIPLSDFAGLTNRANLAQMVLSGDLPTVFIDNVYFYEGGMTGGPTTPETAAPTPTQDAADVISIFSDSYTSVDGVNLNPNWGQSTAVSEESIDGNNTLKYGTFNYQGTEFTQLDVSGMDFLHIDMWTADATDAKMTPISASSGEFLTGLTPITSGAWASYDIPLSTFTDNGMSLADIIQLKFDGQGGVTPSNLWLDNIYFYKEGTTGGGGTPSQAAPAPTAEAADVVSIFSDSYTSVDGVNLNPNWGQSTVVSEEMIDGNNTLKYGTFNYQGTEFAQQDVSGMDFLHVDMWTDDATDVKMTPISASSGEFLTGLTPISNGAWASYDIPLSTFTDNGVSLADIFQLKFDGQGGNTPSNLWLDNIYFYKEATTGGGGMPSEAAPDPTIDPDKVISVFSDAYTDLMGTDFNPNWGQSTAVTTEDVAGNATLKYGTFNYQGTQFGADLDLSTMEFLHIDMWTDDATDVKVTPISKSSGEFLTGLTPITNGTWVSYDIPLSSFTDNGVSLSDIIQLKFDGQGGVTPSNLWLDNIFFYRTVDLPMSPSEGAPTPTADAARVISIFSDSYTSVDGLNLNPNWGQSTQVSEEKIADNNTLVYSTFNYQGLEMATQDLSGMAYLHIDMWTADATDVRVTPISASTGENLVSLTPLTSGVWNSYDIPLSAFTDGGMTLADVIQMKFDGQAGQTPSTLYLDNIYFYSDGANGPAEAAPTPTVDAADVISVYSDVYTDIDGTDFNPNWGQATVVTEEDVAGNKTLLYTGLNYQGVQLGSSADVSGMTHLHLDVWTNNSSALNVFLISNGPAEKAKAITVPTDGWLSLEIPLSDFDGVDLTDIIQFKFDGNGDIYIDNIYFRK